MGPTQTKAPRIFPNQPSQKAKDRRGGISPAVSGDIIGSRNEDENYYEREIARANSLLDEDEQRINISIDGLGQSIKCKKGETIYDIIQAQRRKKKITNKTNVDVICHHPLLTGKKLGNEKCCGVCQVEIEQVINPFEDENSVPIKEQSVRSCTQKVEDNMTLRTSNTSHFIREKICESLKEKLSNHFLDCGNCYYDGKCHFKQLIDRHGVTPSSLNNSEEQRKRFRIVNDLGSRITECEAVVHDKSKCLECYRCIRICDQQGYLPQDIKIQVENGGYGSVDIEDGFFKKMFESDRGNNISICISCGLCTSVCSLAGCYESLDHRKILKELFLKEGQTFVAIIDPVLIPNLSELFGNPQMKKSTQNRRREPQVSHSNQKHWKKRDESGNEEIMGKRQRKERFGKKENDLFQKVMITLLKQIGFDYVFNGGIGVDLKTLFEKDEFLRRLKKLKDEEPEEPEEPEEGEGEEDLSDEELSFLYEPEEWERMKKEEIEKKMGEKRNNNFPMFSSECYSFRKLIENERPNDIGNISSVKPAYLIMADLIKKIWWKEERKRSDLGPSIVVVYISPCIAKKEEIKRNDLYDHINVDYVITVREMLKMLEKQKKNLLEYYTKFDTQRKKRNERERERGIMKKQNQMKKKKGRQWTNILGVGGGVDLNLKNKNGKKRNVYNERADSIGEEGIAVELVDFDVIKFYFKKINQKEHEVVPSSAGFLSGISGGQVESLVRILSQNNEGNYLGKESTIGEKISVGYQVRQESLVLDDGEEKLNVKVKDNIFEDDDDDVISSPYDQMLGEHEETRKERENEVETVIWAIASNEELNRILPDEKTHMKKKEYEREKVVIKEVGVEEKIQYAVFSIHGGGEEILKFLPELPTSSAPCFGEVNICHGGCIGGAGNSKIWKEKVLERRHKNVYLYQKSTEFERKWSDHDDVVELKKDLKEFVIGKE